MPLAVQWGVTGGQSEMAGRAKGVVSDIRSGRPAHSAPASLSTPECPASVLHRTAFACGSRDAWIEIFIRRVSRGRDMTADLAGLTQAAQRLFGVLHNCTPTAASG
jgi:hypothetical protein